MVVNVSKFHASMRIAGATATCNIWNKHRNQPAMSHVWAKLTKALRDSRVDALLNKGIASALPHLRRLHLNWLSSILTRVTRDAVARAWKAWVALACRAKTAEKV